MNFDAQARPTLSDVNAVHQHQEPCHAQNEKRDSPTESAGVKDLRQTLEGMSTGIEALETGFQQKQTFAYFDGGARNHQRYRDQGRRRVCYLCGEEGRFKRECPLNSNRPVLREGGSWSKQH